MGYNPEYHKAYRLKNKEKVSEAKKLSYQKKKELYKARTKKYALENKEAQNKSKRKYHVNKLKNNPMFKLSRTVSHQLYLAIKQKKGGRRWETVVGYSLQELKNHLELLFTERMTWENYGEWHIDHINPVCSFNLDEYEQFNNCWKLDNLRPLWKQLNLSKASEDKKKKFLRN